MSTTISPPPCCSPPPCYTRPVRTSTSTSSASTAAKRQRGIGKRALSLRKATRAARIDARIDNVVGHPPAANYSHSPAANYTARVLSGEFEPTALRARTIAASRGQSLHELAHELGYADAPPRVRQPLDLGSLSRSKLATLTGYHISDLSRLFARRHPPSLTKLAKVAAAYGATLDDTLSALGW